jgi:hypothetical protein
MDSTTLSDTMEQERQRLTKVLEQIMEKRIALDQEERVAKIELSGIQAYLDAKMGKVMVQQTITPKKRGPSGSRGPRQTGIKERVLEVITAEGISKQDILAKLEASNDEKMQQAISNALVALKKDNKIDSPERGKYTLVTAAPAEPPAPAPAPTPKRVKKEEAQPT